MITNLRIDLRFKLYLGLRGEERADTAPRLRQLDCLLRRGVWPGVCGREWAWPHRPRSSCLGVLLCRRQWWLKCQKIL